jgi:hypothetical protein
MAKHPWRLQGEIAKGETDPVVTVFMGAERAIMDDNGEPTAETFIEQDASDPVTLPLSQAMTALATTGELEKLRKEKSRARPV